LGFAPLPRGRFAFFQDVRKYTRGRELVAIGLMPEDGGRDGRRHIRAQVEQHCSTLRRSHSACRSKASEARARAQAPPTSRRRPRAATSQGRFGAAAQGRLAVCRYGGSPRSRRPSVRSCHHAYRPSVPSPRLAPGHGGRESTKWLCLVIWPKRTRLRHGALLSPPCLSRHPRNVDA